MQNLSTIRRQHRWELILKEIDQIHSTIKNLDDIIFKNKNFCFLFWGGSLYLIVEHLGNISPGLKIALTFLTGLIPLLFLGMDYNWRKHLMQCSRRERNISHFLNSEAFEQLVLQGEKDLNGKKFPLFDVVGWIYTSTADENTDGPYLAEYLINPQDFRGWRVILYKDAGLYYGSMLLVSIILGTIYIVLNVEGIRNGAC